MEPMPEADEKLAAVTVFSKVIKFRSDEDAKTLRITVPIAEPCKLLFGSRIPFQSTAFPVDEMIWLLYPVPIPEP
jgi:hypothetical protein